MSDIVTFDYLRENELRISSLSNESYNSNLGEVMGFQTTAPYNKTKIDNIFLSYSSKDKEYINSIIDILESNNGQVYTDIQDNDLPQETNRETATELKRKIKKIPKTIVFVTTNSHLSKWIPWELGLADGSKNIEDIAIFPSEDKINDGEWSNQEYLGIYDKIMKDDKDIFYVSDYKGNYKCSLKDWING